MTSHAFRTAGELLCALREREVGSRELLESALERIERHDGDVNAVVSLDVERARAAADAADRALARGETTGPLHGLPMTVKDTFETAGLRTTAGVPELAGHVPDTDAVAVARLRAAGAVVFGKTNTPTWASDWQTTNPVFGTTRNPWDRERTCGGSSGGSAAALAAGFTWLELGSDIGGSVRVPAHFCGVCGHKPSHGVIPQRGHLPGRPGDLAEPDLNVVGPLARSVADLELAFDVLVGPLAEQARAWKLALPAPRGRSLADYRVAAWLDDAACPVDTEMRSILEQATDALRSAGVRVDGEARPDVDLVDAVHTYLALMMPLNARVSSDAEFAALAAAAAGLPPGAELAHPDGLAARALRALVGSHRAWLAADEHRQRLRARWADFFRDVDVLLCPVTLTPAFPHDAQPDVFARRLAVGDDERSYLEQICWPALVTAALLPSTVVPVGRTTQGLPVGIQVVGPYLEDRSTLAFARLASQCWGGFSPPPGFVA